MALAATLRCPDNDWAPLPDAVAALLEAAEQLWRPGDTSRLKTSSTIFIHFHPFFLKIFPFEALKSLVSIDFQLIIIDFQLIFNGF